MFTGIIRNQGIVREASRRADELVLWVENPELCKELQLGDSVSVNGCCLSVEQLRDATFRFFCTPETVARTTMGDLRPNDRVNLELPLRPSDRLGGHFVQGHVDGVGEVRSVQNVGDSWIFRFRAPGAVSRYLIEKGSVTVDGISLTVMQLEKDEFSVAVIPETWNRTRLSQVKSGTRVNLEADMLAKYVEKLLDRGEKDAGAFQELYTRTFGDSGPSDS